MDKYSNLSFEEQHDLLETLHDRYNRPEFIEADPISIPHSFERAEDKEIAGTKLFGLNEKHTAEFRNRHIGFVFQFHNLLPEFSALENVMMPALIGGAKRKEAKQRALELLEAVGLSARTEHKPAQLSGGEQQRVAIARALINRPSVVLADEPTGNLDTHNRDEIQRLLFEVREKFGQTIVMVTHDERLAEMADRKIVMSDGQVL